MNAGVPDFQRLARLGKLPEGQDVNVPFLAELNAAKKRLARYEEVFGPLPEEGGKKPDENVASPEGAPPAGGKKDDEQPSGPTTVKCDFEGCGKEFTAESAGLANNRLNLHKRTHAPAS